MDDEVKALDEQNGEWILCRTCAEHYERTGRGRKPNDPDGFKVKMNGRFQEAAWIMHKNRVVAHKVTAMQDGTGHDSSGGSQDSPIPAGHRHHHRDVFLREHDDVIGSLPVESDSTNHHHQQQPPVDATRDGSSSGSSNSHIRSSHDDASFDMSHRAKRLKTATSSGSDDSDDAQQHHVGLDLDSHESSGPFFMEEMKFDDDHHHPHHHHHHHYGRSIQLPRTGWRCPGVVPDFFYQANAELVHAFSKYYVGSYRVNVVRDIRSDKVMIYSHDCENRIVHRERPNQPISCDKCYSIWLHNKSFKRILKKMDRYNHVEDILRKSWSITEEELSVLSKFKHASGANLNIEGRKLKQAAITVLKRFNVRKSPQEKTTAMMASYARVPARVGGPQLSPDSSSALLRIPSLDSAMPDDDDHAGLASGASATEHAQALETPIPSDPLADQQQQENAEV
uniref:Uncharacterized protein n=1 Tax=Globisporangium ultimum (strain ATCC 200006 / CBS 805.95 / DAOM BR144) TaxID=431595 RepID=K3W9Z2_GLOUD